MILSSLDFQRVVDFVLCSYSECAFEETDFFILSHLGSIFDDVLLFYGDSTTVFVLGSPEMSRKAHAKDT